MCGILLQQFVVDIYIKIERTRLEFYRFEQSNYRREILEGIVDSVSASECRVDKVGQRYYYHDHSLEALGIYDADIWMQWLWFRSLDDQIFSSP